MKMKTKTKVNEFYLGMLILMIVSVRIFNKAIMYSGVFAGFKIAKFSLYSLFVVIPAMIGLLMFFYNRKSIIGMILSILGSVLWLVSMILFITIASTRFSVWEYIISAILIIASIYVIVESFLKDEQRGNNVIK